MTAITIIDDLYNDMYPHFLRRCLPSSQMSDGLTMISTSDRLGKIRIFSH